MIDGAQKGRSLQSQAIATTEANEANAIRLGDARIAMAKSGAAGIEAQGSAQGHASMMGGLSSGISSLAGGLGSMGGGFSYAGGPGSAGTAMGAGGGSVGGIGTLGPNYGFPSP